MALLLCFLLFFCSGCHYHIGQGGVNERYSSIAIPYAANDNDGRLTAALIKKMSESGLLHYDSDSGELTLLVKLIKYKNKNIGFRYDRFKKKDALLNTIIPTETRRTAWCEITVMETCSGKILIGPVLLNASVEFDHDYYSSRDGVNIFSLGQLGDIDAAYDASLTPLYEKLAEKITDYVNNSW